MLQSSVRNRTLAGEGSEIKRSFVLSFKMRGKNRYMYAHGNVTEVKNLTDEREGTIGEEMTLSKEKIMSL